VFPFLDQLLADPNNAQSLASHYLTLNRFVGRGQALKVPIRELDAWLVEHDNHATPKDVVTEFERLLGGRLSTAVASAKWRSERQRVFDSLLACIIARTEPAVGTELTRLLLIFGLVESLALTPSPIMSADEVENALRYRTVLLPKEILKLIPRRARLARRYGVADLYVVRDEWNRYEAGEIAHIENVLPFESKKRSLSTLSETETTIVSETEIIDTEEHDSQTTDRREVQNHAQTETNLAVHVAAQVDVQASYGAMEISATAGGSFDYSQKNAEDHAYQQSHEMITRAVKRVEQRVKTIRTTRSLQRTTENNDHALNNRTAQSVIGMYRWVDKVQRMQLFRYPHRLLLEFEIPEPAAYLMWRRKQPRGDYLTPEPVALVRRDAQFKPIYDDDKKPLPLQPSDITESTYLWWVAQYNVVGVNQPPAERIQIRTVLELKQQIPTGTSGGGGADSKSYDIGPSIHDKSWFDLIAPGGSESQPAATIPQGYRLESWDASGYATNVYLTRGDGTEAVFLPNINVMVGNKSVNLSSTLGGEVAGLVAPGGNPDRMTVPPLSTWVYSDGLDKSNYSANSPVTGAIQVSALATSVRECRVHVTLHCIRMNAGLLQWQQQTYEQISAAYWALKRQRADEQAIQAIGTGVEIRGDPPARNKEVILEELKRGVIEMLTGENFQGRNAMQDIAADKAPQVDLDEAITAAEEIQFLEQSFEWENLTYVLYPYFWADSERWQELADVTLSDPEFARFLRSGSARVVVPARPKFENQVRMYVDFGALWGGGPVPTVNDPEYLSVAAEIMAQQSPPEDGEKRRSWEVRLPTTLVWLDNASTLPKVNPQPTLDEPPGVLGP
jgi:hypothetical protein